jgi:hypothetical protein
VELVGDCQKIAVSANSRIEIDFLFTDCLLRKQAFGAKVAITYPNEKSVSVGPSSGYAEP